MDVRRRLAHAAKSGGESAMSADQRGYIVRGCAQKLIKLFDQRGNSQPALEKGITEVCAELIDRPDLNEFGAKRQGNFVNNSRFLYYDGQLEITLNQMPFGKQFPAHDHGTCEALIIYRGQLSHTTYQRVDDGRRKGYAELAVIDDRVLRPGDIVLMMPPVEIHSFRAVTEDTFVLTVVEGQYKPNRHFYRPNERTYSIGTPQAAMAQSNT
jgi:predicted metal-dependent enzyme (double-stranded beta helix superfamily)